MAGTTVAVDTFKQLKQVIADNQYVLVFSRRNKTELALLERLILRMVKSRLPVKLVDFNALKVAREPLEELKLYPFPSVDFFLEGHQRKFVGDNARALFQLT